MNPSQRVYVIYYAGDEKRSSTITEVESCDCFGIPCIKGKFLGAKTGYWAAGITTYIPVSKVDSIIEFDSFELYEQRRARHVAAKQDRPPEISN